MLTKTDLKYNFFALGFLSKIWRFPARFDRSSGSFRITRGRRRLQFRILLLFFTAHVLLVSGRTFEAGVISRNLPLEFLAFGICESAAYLGICVLGLLVHLKLETQVKIWNEVLSRLDKEGSSSQAGKKTWQELGICYFPLFLYPAVLGFPFIYLIKADLPFLLYGNVPEIMKCTPVLVACCLCDTVILLFHINMSNYFAAYGMLFMRQMKNELKSLKDKLERFRLHPESGITRKANVPSRADILEVQPRKQSVTGSGTTADVEVKLKRQEKIQFISEVKKRVKDSSRGDGKGQLQNIVKDQTDLEMIHVIEQQGGDIAGTSMSCKSQNVATLFQVDSKPGAQKGSNLAHQLGRKFGVKAGRKWMLNTMRKMLAKARKKYGNKVDDKWAISVKGRWEDTAQQEESPRPGPSWAVKNEDKILVVKSQNKCDFELQEIVVVDSQDKGTASLEEKPGVKPRGKRLQKTVKKLTVEAAMEMEILMTDQVMSDIRELNDACKTLENIRLLFRLFNESFSDSAFIIKLLCITVPIWGAFSAVRLAQTHPHLALCYGLTAVDVALHYVATFNDSFHLTGQAERCKSLILIHSSLLVKKGQISKDHWNGIRCRVAAIPHLAVFTGHFHILERNSTLILLNFIMTKLADLLLTF